MKFKRTIASILAATFSLTLIGQSAPKAFAKGETPEITTEQKLDSKTQEELNQKVKKLDEQGKLDELKENSKTSVKGIKNVFRYPLRLAISAIIGLVSVTVVDKFFVGTINKLADSTFSSVHFVVPKKSYAIVPLILVLLESIDLYTSDREN